MTRDDEQRNSRWLLALLFGAPPLLYFATMLRTIGLPDSAIIIDAMRGPVLSSHVNNHNLNNLVGFLFQQLPFGEIVWRSNLSAVFCASAALWIFFFLLRALRAPQAVALATTFVLMVSHSFWWHGTQAESYALSAAMLCACALLVAKDEIATRSGRPGGFFLPLACFLASLAIFNHVQNAILSLGLTAYGLMNLRRFFERGGALLVRCACAWMLGVLPYMIVAARDLVTSDDRGTTLAWMAGGGFRQLMFNFHPSHALGVFGDWVVMQFLSPFLFIIPIGFFVLARSNTRRGLAVFLATIFVTNTVFFMGYETWDQFAFYLPSFICLALAGGLGATFIMERSRGLWFIRNSILLIMCVCFPPIAYVNITEWAARPGGYWNGRYGRAHEAYRERYDLVGMYADPIFHDRGSIDQFARSLLTRLPPDAWLIDDVSIYYQLEFLRREAGARPDLRIELVRPLNMAGWGTEASDIASEALLATNRIFITAVEGPCAAVVAEFLSRGSRTPRAFDLGGGRCVYEMIPSPPGNIRRRE